MDTPILSTAITIAILYSSFALRKLLQESCGSIFKSLFCLLGPLNLSCNIPRFSNMPPAEMQTVLKVKEKPKAALMEGKKSSSQNLAMKKYDSKLSPYKKQLDTRVSQLKEYSTSNSTPKKNMSTTTSAPVPVIKPCNKPQIQEEAEEVTDNPKQCEILRNMNSEKDRLLTFVNWPNPGIDPKELAKAGFYSIRYEDAVRCAFCKVEICRWEEGDNAMSDHQRWSNSCPFVRGVDVGNIPLDPNEKVELPRLSQDTCGRYGIEIRPYSVPERSEQPISLNKLGITPNKKPSFPLYSTKESRINTFREWPLSIKQKPDELAEAGFFYIGKGDQTMCFLCGGGLKDWLEGDDPWEQHARWFPKCSFVLMVKGREFVSEVSNRLPAMLTSQQGADLKSEAGASKNKSAPSTATAATASPSEKPTAAAAAAVAETSTKREKVDDGRLCKICYMEELGVVFLPCGHIVACVKCAPSLSTCAVCRQPFSATVRAFLS